MQIPSLILKNKRHICLFAAAYVLGILIFRWSEQFWPLFLIPAFVLAGIVWKKYGNSREILITEGITIFLVCLACALSSTQVHRYEQWQAVVENWSDIKVEGTVYKKEQKSDQFVYYLKHCKIVSGQSSQECGTIQFYYSDDEVQVGATVMGYGDISLFEHAANEGNFDAANYYQSQNIVCRIFGESLEVVKSSKFSWKETLYQLQKAISNVFDRELNTEDAGILCTLVLGNRSVLDEDIKEMYQSAGISHILAISGLHISVLGLSIFRFMRKRTGSYLIGAVTGSIVVISFALMSGFGTSAQRAAVMYLVMMGAEVSGRKYEMSHGIAAAALLILMRNPLALFQSGFQFSFLSMIAILFIVPITQRDQYKKRQSTGKKIWDTLRQQLLSGLILQLWLLPLTAWYYFEIPLYAMFLNLLVLPLCSWLLGAGIAGGIVGIWFLVPSKWMLILCHFILKFYHWIIDISSKMPFSQIITGRPAWQWMPTYYGCLLLVCVYLAFPGVRAYLKYMQGTKFTVVRWTYRHRFFLLLLPAFIMILFFAVPENQEFRVDFLDVGQGDGICISSSDGAHIFIDGGSTSVDNVGTYRILPFLKYQRIQKVDVWIVTHTDEDHISGLEEALEKGYEIKTLVAFEGIEEDSAWEEIQSLAQKNSTTIIPVSAGQKIQCSDFSMKCLYPDASTDTEDKNDASLVWLLENNGRKILFTGDVGADAEEKMLSMKCLEDVDVLKVAHHGSKNSSTMDFIEKVKPEIAVISCGKNNRYGHPHQETLERLEECESEIVRTDENNQITLREKKGIWMLYFPMKN